jgi:hypothetical protein
LDDQENTSEESDLQPIYRHTTERHKMTDKELLELALKASLNGEEIAGFTINEILSNSLVFDDIIKRWNPLTDDGDALRLAVKLRMHVSIFPDAIGIGTPGGGYTETKWVDDANAATRRAITRAAAEIGKTMKS